MRVQGVVLRSTVVALGTLAIAAPPRATPRWFRHPTLNSSGGR
jgi:hypothetical protein